MSSKRCPRTTAPRQPKPTVPASTAVPLPGYFATSRRNWRACVTLGLDQWRLAMNAGSRATEHPKTEDDIQRKALGPQGVPGAKDRGKMTPELKKRVPKNIDPGHTA